MNKNGWKMIGSACCGPAGSIVIYDETAKGSDHAAFSVGGGLICQHNPYRCRCLLLRTFFHVCCFCLSLNDHLTVRLLQHLGRLGQPARFHQSLITVDFLSSDPSFIKHSLPSAFLNFVL
jgi:hypothetical protein